MVGLLSKVMGLLLILTGLGLGLTTLAFASLIDPSLQGDAWWAEFWNGMETRGGWGGVGFGLVMATIGGWLVVVPPSPVDEVSSKSTRIARDEER